MPPSPWSDDLCKIGNTHFGNDIDQKEYLTPITTNWLGRKFACAEGTRMESELEQFGDIRFSDSGSVRNYMFALKRGDNLWDLFYDHSKNKKWTETSRFEPVNDGSATCFYLDLLLSGDREINKLSSEHKILKLRTGISESELPWLFSNFSSEIREHEKKRKEISNEMMQQREAKKVNSPWENKFPK